MSLGRKLSLHAGAALASDDRRVPRPRGQHEPVARPHRYTFAAGEDEIDRAAGAVENLRVLVLVLAIRIARRVRPPVHVPSFVAQRSLDRAGIGRRGSVVPTVLELHVLLDQRAEAL